MFNNLSKWDVSPSDDFMFLRISGYWSNAPVGGSRIGLGPPGLPGFLPKTPFSCVPIYLRDIPLIFGHSKPQAQQEKQENEGKRGKGKESWLKSWVLQIWNRSWMKKLDCSALIKNDFFDDFFFKF